MRLRAALGAALLLLVGSQAPAATREEAGARQATAGPTARSDLPAPGRAARREAPRKATGNEARGTGRREARKAAGGEGRSEGGEDRPGLLQTLAQQGAELRERGEPEAALALLQRGHDEMLRRDRDGPGLQAYLEGLGLQAEYGMTLIQLGRVSVGEEFIATARRTVDLAYARRELEPPQGAGAFAPLVAAALRGGEALETRLAEFYAVRVAAPPPGLDARQASERMSEAYRRAETWVLRAALEDRRERAAARVEAAALQRVAALRLAQARGLLAAGRGPEAAAEFVAAAALGCGAGGRLGTSGCERASRGWAEAVGALAFDEAGRWQEALGFDAAGAVVPAP